jgi:hypothetical protein
MPQHKKITLSEVEDTLDLLEHMNYHDEEARIQDLLRVLVKVDQMLVKHEHTPLARSLRQAYFRYKDNI